MKKTNQIFFFATLFYFFRIAEANSKITLERKKSLNSLLTEKITKSRMLEGSIEEEKENLVCRKDLQKILGFKVEDINQTKPETSHYKLLTFCRQNKQTCCTLKEVTDITSTYFASIDKISKLLEPIEEFLTLFKGEKIESEILEYLEDQENIKAKGCTDFAKSKLSNEQVDFSKDSEFVKAKMIEIRTLTLEFTFYFKKQKWFFGDLICTLCNPYDQKHVSDKNEEFTLNLSESTWLELFETTQFENRLDLIYGAFIKPTLDTFRCINPNEGEPFRNDKALPELDWKSIQIKQDKLEECRKKFDDNCLKLWKQDPTSFEFPSSTLKAYVLSLESIFPILVEKVTVEEFYKEKKNESFIINPPNKVVVFDIKDSKKKFITEFLKDNGSNLFTNYFNKNYLEHEHEILQEK